MAFTRFAMKKTTTNLALDYKCDIILADTSGGAITLTLPSPKQNQTFTIKNIGTAANNVTIDRNGSLIDNSASNLLLADLDSIQLVANGIGWWIVTGGGV